MPNPELGSHHRPGFYLRVIQEGDVGSGDEIIKVSDGPERMSVAAVSALLYLPGHDRQQLTRALRIPALSAGWQHSFRALLDSALAGDAVGNAGLAPAVSPPAWTGFRRLRVASRTQESETVFSLTLEPADDAKLAVPLPGQFVTLRVVTARGSSPLIRSYSLSGSPSASRYRVSIKREGLGSSYIGKQLAPGDVIEAAAPRGTFVLQPSTRQWCS